MARGARAAGDMKTFLVSHLLLLNTTKTLDTKNKGEKNPWHDFCASVTVPKPRILLVSTLAVSPPDSKSKSAKYSVDVHKPFLEHQNAMGRVYVLFFLGSTHKHRHV
jgi:hypothetical protein